MNRNLKIKYIKLSLLMVLFAFIYLTWADITPAPDTLLPQNAEFKKLSIRDRVGEPLLISYQNNLNFHDYRTFSEIPEFLVKSFVYLEDKKFYSNHGVDWPARLAAFYQNVKNLRVVRGASTITEQVVRILNPRKRSLWARWIEGFEAEHLENKFQKNEILEFYLNEVPYAAKRRGVSQAARTYFNRDIDTLNHLEMLCLAYLVRAPGKYAPTNDKEKLEARLKLISEKMYQNSSISEDEFNNIKNSTLQLEGNNSSNDLSHFVRYVESNRSHIPSSMVQNGKLITSIDSTIQKKTKELLENRISELKDKNVSDGAVLIIDHNKNEILAWVNAGSDFDDTNSGTIDAVLTPRQPGSTLKPLLYALALENGWTASTIINDSPLIQAIGNGMHTYRNYSRVHYGNIRLREALGNSLNIPAIRAVQFVGVNEFHKFLFKLGFSSLTNTSAFYGEGLALGNGEVSLYELVQAYTVLARSGIKHEVSYLLNDNFSQPERVISRESSQIISDILSDSHARRYEFGRHGVLNFPVPTAVKTGTSTDFKDVWAVGYSRDYTAGVWMGNLNREPMIDLSGVSGPGLLLRSVFNELYKFKEPTLLLKNSNLQKKRICSVSGKLAGPHCPTVSELFNVNNTPKEFCDLDHKSGHTENQSTELPEIMFPTPGLQIAMDPRVPDESEAIKFKLTNINQEEKVEWILDGSNNSNPLWKLEKGKHTLLARVFNPAEKSVYTTDSVNFYVK